MVKFNNHSEDNQSMKRIAWLILFIPMIAVLVFVILAPDVLLWLPRLLMPKLVN